MVQKGLAGFFEKYLEKEPLFINKGILQVNYTPDTIPHRDKQINYLAEILAPCLRLEKPSNLFIYGKTGTGKTLSVKYTTKQIMDVAQQRGIGLHLCYVNCKLKRVADTEYRLIAQLIESFGHTIPATGLPTDEVYNIFYKLLEKEKKMVIVVLDEIDQLVKKSGDEILYNLTRINSDMDSDSQITLIGISNDLIFADNLDPRIRSSLSEEEVLFPPYNAFQLKDILKRRSKHAFKKGVLQEGVLEKCSAYAAREHGDARRAVELLRVAGEIAERKGFTNVEIQHLDEAEEKIEKDRLVDIVTSYPRQFQVTLYSIMSIYQKRKDIIYTGEVYDLYKGVCRQINLRPLTQRRVSDIIGELDMLGLINARVISKGRMGRTREISLPQQCSSNPKILKLLKESLNLD